MDRDGSYRGRPGESSIPLCHSVHLERGLAREGTHDEYGPRTNFRDERRVFPFVMGISVLGHVEGDSIRNLIAVKEMWSGVGTSNLRRSSFTDLDLKSMCSFRPFPPDRQISPSL